MTNISWKTPLACCNLGQQSQSHCRDGFLAKQNLSLPHTHTWTCKSHSVNVCLPINEPSGKNSKSTIVRDALPPSIYDLWKTFYISMYTWGEQQWVKPNHLLNVVNAVCSFDQKGCQRQRILLFWNHTCSRACGLGNLAMARYIRCPGRFCLPANLTPISQTETHICATISPKTFIWLQKPYPIIVDFPGDVHIQVGYSESFLVMFPSPGWSSEEWICLEFWVKLQTGSRKALGHYEDYILQPSLM